MSDLISVEDGLAQGATASPVAMVVSLGKVFRVPYSVFGANVLSFWEDPRNPGAFICNKVATQEPLIFDQRLILVFSTAPLLGFFNSEPGVLSPAYGKPVLSKAWTVAVGSTIRPFVIGDAILYESVALSAVEEYKQTPEVAS